MARLINAEDLPSLSEQVTDVNVPGILSDILRWQEELDNSIEDKIRYAVLDSVVDIILDNCVID